MALPFCLALKGASIQVFSNFDSLSHRLLAYCLVVLKNITDSISSKNIIQSAARIDMYALIFYFLGLLSANGLKGVS